MAEDEAYDDDYSDEFDDLATDKAPVLTSKNKREPKRKRSLVGKLSNEVYKVFEEACKDINNTTNVIEKTDTNIKDNFRTGNNIQLVSRSSGRTLEIVTSPTGQLVIDGVGAEGPQITNAVWFVTDLKNNIVTLHNNNNFLAVVDGSTCLRYYPDTNQVGRETHFRVIQVQNNFVCLESLACPGKHVGIQNNGQLKSALATGREMDGQFGVRLIYTPYPSSSAAGSGQPSKAASYQVAPPAYPGHVMAAPGATSVTVVSTQSATGYPPAAPPPYK